MLMLLRSGTYFDFKDMAGSPILIRDIAHSLARIGRFNGHTEHPTRIYSVAQHSVVVSQAVPPEFALEGLLHDATEAYLGDVVTGLKDLLPGYQAIEKELHEIIAGVFGFPAEMSHCVYHADVRALLTEKGICMNCHDDWGLPAEALNVDVRPWDIPTAQVKFLERFIELTGLG